MKRNGPDTSLKRLRSDLPRLIELLQLTGEIDTSSWTHVLDSKLLPRLAPDFPLVAAICGAGSSGKSTLFNSLVGSRISPTGGRAGINRRILMSIRPEHSRDTGFLETLFSPLGCGPTPLSEDPDELTVAGPPLFTTVSRLPLNLVLMDTPDFDTGAKGEYTNREIAMQALETADILIYIFTNSNYNNRDNTDFISQVLTDIGTRKCFLVYRVYPSFRDEEVHAHAMTVARNIYGDSAADHVLGIFRADEDNQVASGVRLMELTPAAGTSGGRSLPDTLARLDFQRIRIDLFASMLEDVLEQGSDMLTRGRISLNELKLYRDALQTVQGHCAHDALQHFPLDMVMKRFAQIWQETDPSFVKFMRRTGAVVEFPLRAVINTVKWTRERLHEGETTSPSNRHFGDLVKEDLLIALNTLQNQAVSPEIAVTTTRRDPVGRRMQERIAAVQAYKKLQQSHAPHAAVSAPHQALTVSVPAHPAIRDEQQVLQGRDWKQSVTTVLAHKDSIVSLTQTIENELAALAGSFRRRMDFIAKVRQTFAAMLNVLPATAAVTYVLSTGDPVGAVGIKVKLAGLFGLHDLYALIAIPATSGMKQADRRQLEDFLGPVAQTWLNNKLELVNQLFETEITGMILLKADAVIQEAADLIQRIEKELEAARKL